MLAIVKPELLLAVSPREQKTGEATESDDITILKCQKLQMRMMCIHELCNQMNSNRRIPMTRMDQSSCIEYRTLNLLKPGAHELPGSAAGRLR